MRISDCSSDVCSSDLLLRRYSVKLQAGQPGVKSSLANQIVVRTLFDNLACIHHHDAVGRANGGQTMRDHDGGAVTHQTIKSVLDQSFGFGIERSEEHTSALPSLMRISYAVFCMKKNRQL